MESILSGDYRDNEEILATDTTDGRKIKVGKSNKLVT